MTVRELVTKLLDLDISREVYMQVYKQKYTNRLGISFNYIRGYCMLHIDLRFWTISVELGNIKEAIASFRVE